MTIEQSNISSGHEPIILASRSPRRKELLQQIGVPFQCLDHSVKETQQDDEPPHTFVHRMAREKARSVQSSLSADKNPVVLGADTLVICGKQIMGKPTNRDDACEMLATLSGQTHQVLTAVAVARDTDLAAAICVTDVEFKELTSMEIEQYWDTGEPEDKAGAYAIQGLGGVFVKRIKGSYSGVVGLPLFETALLLNRFGVTCWQKAPQTTEAEQ